MDTAKITTEAIRELAKKHPGVIEDLKALCPDAFPEPIKFEDGMELWSSAAGVPCLLIGTGLAPEGLEMRCLVVTSGYRMEMQEHNGYTILTFYRK